MKRLSPIVALACCSALMASVADAQERRRPPRPAPLSLRVANESEPPSGIVQMKFEITEPVPITTGGGYFSMDDVQSVDGIAIGVPDAAGVAIVRGGCILNQGCTPATAQLSFVFPTDPTAGLFDYPIATIAGRIRSDAVAGHQTPLTLDPGSLNVTTPTCGPTPSCAFEVAQGELTIDQPAALAVTDVVPGSALVPAGGVVTIRGLNFTPRTQVRFNEVDLSAVRFIDSTRIDVVVASPTQMHGMRIRLRNRRPDDRTTYYSYQRTTWGTPSTDSFLALAHPVFPLQPRPTAGLTLPASAAPRVYGVGLQNLGAAPVTVQLDLVGLGGGAIGLPQSVTVGPNQRLVRGTFELFRQTCGTGCLVTMTASAPVQVLGVSGDEATSSATPILPN
jgi:hypothetical protein